MPAHLRRLMRSALLVAGATIVAAVELGSSNVRSQPSVSAVFAGSSPAEESIRPFLQIPQDAKADLIEWKLTLHQDPRTAAPANYHLQYTYGLTVPGKPGLGPVARSMERRGSWRIVKGTNARLEAIVYELDGTVSLFRVSDSILHVLNRDRSLMIGTSGWSYTLNRSGDSEARVDPSAETGASESRTISPAATGPSVFGIFEGRSPCQGIARELTIAVSAGCAKVKWRVTLYQDPETREPTSYKVESSLHRSAAREGRWTIVRGTGSDPAAAVYRLAAAGSEAPLLLMKGDDHVLFFMDRNGRPLTANADFSYTLNRRKPAA
jgi:hypothetical protein